MARSIEYTPKEKIDEYIQKDRAVIIPATEAEDMRLRGRNLVTRREKINAEKRKSARTRAAILIASIVLGGGVAAKVAKDSLHPSPVFHGEKIVQVKPGDSLEGILEARVKGIDNFDIRVVEQKVIDNPDNADVLKDKDGVMVHPGERIEIPKSLE